MADGKKSREDLIKQLTSQVAAKSTDVSKGKKPPTKSKETRAPDIQKTEEKKAPVPGPSHFRTSSHPVKDYSKEKLSDKMFAGWKKALAKENSPERIGEIVKNILEGKKSNFTGYVEVEFEDNAIISVSENPIEVDAEVKDQLIDKSKFEPILEYLKNPQDAPPEIVKIAEGLTEEKIQKAIEIGADHIIKKPVIKVDGTIEYNIVASVEETPD